MQLLLEIGTEELPPSEIAPALEALADAIRRGAATERLMLGEIRTLATPRRLTILIDDVAEVAEDLEELQVGPSLNVAFEDDGTPTRAGIGFARGKGIEPAELQRVETDKGTYVAALVREEGRTAMEIFEEFLPAAIAEIPWKRSMRWGWGETTFARPITWLVALLDGHVIEFEFAGHRSHRTTYGHRFLAPEPIELAYPSAYVTALRDAYVLVDPEERTETIRLGLRDAASSLGLERIADDELIAEVVQLVEWPVPLIGRFDDSLLEVPREVLITSMRTHQRYFAFEDSSGKLANAFCFIANIVTDDPDIIVTGNQRVLVARLEDARFFWNEDRKRTLESRLEDLENVRYIEGLGSVRDRSRRIAAVSRWLASRTAPDDEAVAKHAERAATLSKADLTTGMVYEFGELQGTMGRYYALADGEPVPVAAAIEEHYRPRSASDGVARGLVGALVAIAEKSDTLVGCLALDLAPSGSADPYGLRRAAIGLLRTVIEHDLTLPLRRLLEKSYEALPDGVPRDRETTVDAAHAFLTDRLRALIEAPTDIVNAVVAVETDRLSTLRRRAEALDELRANADFEPLAAAFKRVVNILSKAEGDDPALAERLETGALTVRFERLAEEAEQTLHEALEEAASSVNAAIDASDFPRAAGLLIGLKGSIDAFFDDVMVNAESVELRENRLALLHRIRTLFLRFADLSRIQVS